MKKTEWVKSGNIVPDNWKWLKNDGTGDYWEVPIDETDTSLKAKIEAQLNFHINNMGGCATATIEGNRVIISSYRTPLPDWLMEAVSQGIRHVCHREFEIVYRPL